jgi:hypothetical protein
MPPSPPAEKATASQDQAWKSSTGDGAGNGGFIQAQKFAMRRSSKRDPGRGEERRTGADIRRRYGERFHR